MLLIAEAELERLKTMSGIELAQRAHELHSAAEETRDLMAKYRRVGLGVAYGKTPNYAQLGRELEPSVTGQWVKQIIEGGTHPESAILGVGKLTVAVGAKVEAGRSDPSRMLSVEALAAYDIFANLAASYEMEVVREPVPPPGIVDLNRSNLVLFTSPRLVPIVQMVLAADDHLEFVQGTTGWYLRDKSTDKTFKSPNGNAGRDYAYIGRLPRPDGKGTFLYLAGIHAMGTLGAARWFADNITDLYKLLKPKTTARWSVLIETVYDPDTREIAEINPVSPIYTAA